MSNFKTHKLTPIKKVPKLSQEKDVSLGESTKKSSHKLRNWFIWGIITIATVLFVGTLALRALGGISLGSMNNTPGEVFTPIISLWTESVEKLKWTKNILIAGIWGQWHEGSHLTDSIMLASIDQDKGNVTLLSIPRDLFVAYPKWYGTAGKINTLYTMGISDKVGIKLLAEKVSEITGQAIDGYMVIDFAGFTSIVDALGGIEIDVPRDLIDREYPNNNWWYQVFRVSAGLQTFDGDTALKYARSRHSTSDFDRSERQQLIMKWIKEKALSLGFLTSPEKISELFTAVRSHIDTSLTIGDATELALSLKDVKSENINIYNLNNECIGSECLPGAYLYTPSREYFGGASVVIPENASATKLSYYDDIRRFTAFIYRFPNIRSERAPISIIAGKWKSSQAKLIMATLSKMWIVYDEKQTLRESTGAITTSHINIYWNNEMEVWIKEDSTIVQALKFIEEKIPYSIVSRNEYVTTDGPRIEIVVGNDISSYFTFARPAYYLPYIAPTASGSTGATTETLSWEKKPNTKPNTKPTTQTNTTPTDTPSPQTESSWPITPIIDTVPEIVPGEWENF